MTTVHDFPPDFQRVQFDNGDGVTGDYKRARGIFAPFWDGEPAEVSVRRLRDDVVEYCCECGEEITECVCHRYCPQCGAFDCTKHTEAKVNDG